MPDMQRGFGLLGVMVAIATLGILAVVTVSTMKGRFAAASADGLVGTQAVEMEELAHAARSYAAHEGALAESGTAMVFTAADMVAAGYLPQSFARKRGEGAALQYTNPFGQEYLAAAIRYAADDTRIVVTEGELPAGNASAARLARAGVHGEGDTLTLKERVALQLATRGSAHVGVIKKGESTVQGVRTGFTKDVADWVGTAAVERTALLLDFPDLDTGGPGLGGPIGFVHQNYTSCAKAEATLANPVASCPAGTTKVVAWPYCGGVTGGTGGDAVWASAVGSITLGKEVRYQPPHYICPPEAYPWGANEAVWHMAMGSQMLGNWCRYGYVYGKRPPSMVPRVGQDYAGVGVAIINGFPFIDEGCSGHVEGVRTSEGACSSDHQGFNGMPGNYVPIPSDVNRRIAGVYCEASPISPIIETHGAGNALNALCCS